MQEHNQEIKMSRLGEQTAPLGGGRPVPGTTAGNGVSMQPVPSRPAPVPGQPGEQMPNPPQMPAPQGNQKPPKKKKKLVFLLFLLILLITAGTVVPVGKVPLLRNMAWMMGFSQEDTEHMSFLKALLTWVDDGFVFRASSPAEDSYSFFDRNGGSGRLVNGRPVSGLFNMQKLNAAQLRQRRRAEQVTGRAGAETLGKDSRSVVRLAGNASAGTDANSTAKGNTVFFGEDASRLQAGKEYGFDTTKGVKRNKNIVNASGNGLDWFDSAVNKATLQGTEILLPRQLGAGQGSLTTLEGLGNVGDKKDVRDLNFAWLLGKAARRSTKPLVRKTLATISWSGGEVPKKVFEVSGASGIGIDPDTVVGDIADIKLKMKEEKECDDKTSAEGRRIQTVMQEAIDQINALKNSFPFNTCEDSKLGVWVNAVREIEGSCRQASSSYQAISTACRVQHGNQGTCSAERLLDMVQTQRETCANMLEEAQRLAQEAAEEAGEGVAPAPVKPEDLNPSEGIGDVSGTGYNAEEVEKNVNRQFNVQLEGKSSAEGDGFFTKPGGSISGGSGSSDESSESSDLAGMLDNLLDRWKK